MGRFMDWLTGSERASRPVETDERSITAVPWVDSYSPFNVPGELTGALSQQRALSLAPVYAANRLIGDQVSTLPVQAYRKVEGRREPLSSLPQLFATRADDGSLVPWLHECVSSLGLRGNAFGLIIARDGFSYPTLIEWLDPSAVMPDERPGKDGWLWNGREVAREQMLHIPLFKVAGQRLGLSPIAAFARTLGVGLTAQDYASGWFGSGGFPPGTFKNSERTVEQAQAEVIKQRLVAAQRTRAPLVYGKDWDYTPISVPPEEAQFVDTMKLTTNQIAAIYGIPPEMIGGESGSSMTYANVEQQQINFVMFTLRPWLVRLESAFSANLPSKQYVRFNADALIRADLATRWNVNKIRVEMGAASIDEIRAQEDEAPLPDGQGQKYGSAAAPAVESQTPGDVTPIRRVQ